MQVFQLLLGLAVLDSPVPYVHSDDQPMDDLTLLPRARLHNRHHYALCSTQLPTKDLNVYREVNLVRTTNVWRKFSKDV